MPKPMFALLFSCLATASKLKQSLLGRGAREVHKAQETEKATRLKCHPTRFYKRGGGDRSWWSCLQVGQETQISSLSELSPLWMGTFQ